MKLLPIPLPPIGAPPLGMWTSDFLWRYPAAPASPLSELKSQLPPQLSPDPRVWNRDDVTVFLQFCEREFDLPKFDMDVFQMNGKALCLLTKNDLAERVPGAGDVLHNVLQMLIREMYMIHKHLPTSPVTPTSRYPFSPHSQPPTPNWSVLAPPDNPFHAAHFQQLMQSNSVTLSPAPSTDSQGRSPPQHQDHLQQTAMAHQAAVTSFANNQNGHSSTSNSNPSDSEEDSYSDKQTPMQEQQSSHSGSSGSPPLTPLTKDAPLSLTQQITNVVNSWSVKKENSNNNNNHNMQHSTNNNGLGSVSAPVTPSAFGSVKREFFPDSPEPNTNGRLLWDFLQQLLNDPNHRYASFIAWKCMDTGVFKIVDPAGLAKLWGIQKNHLSMNYDKMSRALRYYYRVNILRKVQGERHCYQFLRNPTELKSIKNISLLRQQTGSAHPGSQSNIPIKQQPTDVASAAAAALHHHHQQQQQHQHQQQHQNLNNTHPHLQQMHHLAPPPHVQHSGSQMPHPGQLPSPTLHHHMSPPPSSPRVHALNGAFYHLSTSSPVMPHPPQQFPSPPPPPHASHHVRTPSVADSDEDFKMEPNIDIEVEDDLPTDLSTNSTNGGGERKYNGDLNPMDCYPLIRNANGLTTIRLISQQMTESHNFMQHQLQQQQQQPHQMPTPSDEYRRSPSISESEDIISKQQQQQQHADDMATDLRK